MAGYIFGLEEVEEAEIYSADSGESNSDGEKAVELGEEQSASDSWLIYSLLQYEREEAEKAKKRKNLKVHRQKLKAKARRKFKHTGTDQPADSGQFNGDHQSTLFGNSPESMLINENSGSQNEQENEETDNSNLRAAESLGSNDKDYQIGNFVHLDNLLPISVQTTSVITINDLQILITSIFNFLPKIFSFS